ncbi:MAG: phage tail length tape measure family protein [Sulfuricaulis sp.]|nr:phage tail length tape measure family protein [Sulfuricaulis sp.]
MANETKSLTLKIKADVDEAKKNMDRFGGSVKSLAASLAGALGVGFSFKAIIDETVRAEAAFAQIEARIKSTGGAAGFTAQQLAEMASALQKATTFSDEAVLEMQAVLLTFRNVQGDVFRQATEAALDLSTGLGQDLKSSALQLGKALENPVQGLTALRRIGVQFTSEQEKLITNFVRTGDVASAQQVILERVEKGFGGAARAARDTLGGSLKGLQNAFGDLLEAKGGLKDAKAAIEDLTRVLQDPNTAAAVDNITTVVIKGLGKLAEFITAVNFLINGPTEEIGKLDVAIDKIDRKIGALRNSLNVPRAIRATGSGFDASGLDTKLFESDESVNKRLAELVTEREQLMKRLDDLQRKRGEEILKQQGLGGRTAPAGATGAAPPSQEFEKALADLERRIALLGEETAAEQMLFEIQQGRYQDLAKSEQDALLAAARRFDAAKAEQSFEQESEKDLRQQIQTEEEYNRALERTAERLRDSLDPARELYREITQLDELLARGKISADEWMAAMANVHGRIEEVGAKTDETTKGMSEFSKNAARGMQGAFSTYFFDVMQGRMTNLGDLFTQMLERMVAEMAAKALVMAMLGGGWGSALASAFHSGGVVGSGGATREVSPFAFIGAPRLHAGGAFGLRDDEVPAILQRGEVVLSRDQVRGAGPGNVKVQIENKGTPQEVSDSQVTFDPEGMMVNVVLKDITRGGPISGGMARAFNLRRS